MSKPKKINKYVSRKVPKRSNLHPLLDRLEALFEAKRDKSKAPPFPYDEQRGVIPLPAETEQRLRHMVQAGHKVEAVKEVTKLTGAGLRVSKDYVDSLEDA